MKEVNAGEIKKGSHGEAYGGGKILHDFDNENK